METKPAPRKGTGRWPIRASGGRPAPAADGSLPSASYLAHLAALAPLLPGRGLAVDAGTGEGVLLDVLAPLFERVIAVEWGGGEGAGRDGGECAAEPETTRVHADPLRDLCGLRHGTAGAEEQHGGDRDDDE